MSTEIFAVLVSPRAVRALVKLVLLLLFVAGAGAAGLVGRRLVLVAVDNVGGGAAVKRRIFFIFLVARFSRLTITVQIKSTINRQRA
jgi:hypothetical protein